MLYYHLLNAVMKFAASRSAPKRGPTGLGAVCACDVCLSLRSGLCEIK